MTADDKKRELARYRLTQAAESLEEAEYLLRGGKSARSVVNRAYYAMFYAVLALLVHEPFSSSKHSGVISYFNRRFIREGVFSEDLGRSINTAFELRQRSDYREYTDPAREQVESLLVKAGTFLEAVSAHLKSR